MGRQARGVSAQAVAVLIALVMVPVLAVVATAPRRAELEATSKLESILGVLRLIEGSLRSMNVTVDVSNITMSVSLPGTVNASVVNEVLRVVLANDTVRVYVANPELAVRVLNDVLSVFVANPELAVRVLNEPFVWIRNSSLAVRVDNRDPIGVLVVNIPLDVVVKNPELLVRVVNNVGVWIRNSSLNVNVANTPTVLIGGQPISVRAEVANTPLPVTGTVNIGGQPVSVQVVNTAIDVRVTNTPLPVTFSPPVRYFYAVHSGTSSVAAGKHHLCLFNPTTSTRVLYVVRIIVASEVTAAVTGFQIVLRINRVSSVSGGTAVPVVPFDTANPSITVTASTGATATVTATLFSIAINQEETGGDVHRDVDLMDMPIVLRPGEGLCATQYGTAGTGNLAVAFVFYVT